MISYSAEFPVCENSNVKDILNLACEWIAGSPHTKLNSSDIYEILHEDEGSISLGGESIYTGYASVENLEIGGLRYVKLEGDGIEWTTTIVATQTPSQHLISIQVGCESLMASVSLPMSKKPYFVKKIFDEIGGGVDGDIPVQAKPIILEDGEEDIAAALLLGHGKNSLPVVYVSAGFDGEFAVDYVRLAKWLSGSAHVVVEPHVDFSMRIKYLTNSRNVYGGTVGVYWPGMDFRKSYYKRDGESAHALGFFIAKDIRSVLANRRLKTYCTWLHLKECVSRNRLERLKKSGSTAVDEYVIAFDNEISARQARIDEAEAEISRLQMEVHRLQVMHSDETGGLLSLGCEKDLYPGEVRGLVVDSIKSYIEYTVEGSRRRHVLEDIIRHNDDCIDLVGMRERVKAIFKSYVSMDARLRGELMDIGFNISEDGKHHKMVFWGDGRYTFSMSKTSSDVRAGKNFASDINKKLF
ncbi:hypothetical protein [Chromobacterium vaccinii]|uniref:hypothetical protein n=1 Tax=Chromobacterium vaccinii TaxID=1108595 RepID=UPI001E5FE31A|nr:hypothetical protein [Chromobacterium vaccinii]MCD4501388.1 hypothetical protein [Chromobacterium vaccinii]